MKQLYEEFHESIQNDSTIEPISKTVIDLTLSDDEEDNNNLPTVNKSPSKKLIKKSPSKKGKKIRWIKNLHKK
jgi:hypothetical protein